MTDTVERARQAREASPFLSAKQTAFYLGIARNTLKRMRGEGSGPVCRLHGRSYYYHIDDVDAWSAAQQVGGSHG